MSDNNRISAVLADADKASILTKLGEIRALLPFLVSLTPDERKKLPKLGDKTSGFDEKCRDYMTQHPELVPSFVDMDEFNKDTTLLERVRELRRLVGTLSQDLSDTELLLGHEVYDVERAYYGNLELAAKRDTPDAQTIYDDLNARFAGQGPQSKKTTPPPTP
ncbi:MAG: hypothetical protein NTY53_06805 [Kiritimatiellaeota bacterium]|nr:hypothetical protein [Kiritimatiellota bacterium]